MVGVSLALKHAQCNATKIRRTFVYSLSRIDVFRMLRRAASLDAARTWLRGDAGGGARQHCARERALAKQIWERNATAGTASTAAREGGVAMRMSVSKKTRLTRSRCGPRKRRGRKGSTHYLLS